MASNKTKATIGGALNLNGKTQVTKPKRPSPRRSIVDEGEDEDEVVKSKGKVVPLLQEGDIIELIDETVYASVPEHFLYANRKGVFHTFDRGLISLGNPNFEYLRGRYVVYKVAEDGGGTGHGPNDVYPDGHHVYCEMMSADDGERPKVDFYQTGCFTALITHLWPVGKAHRVWVEPAKTSGAK